MTTIVSGLPITSGDNRYGMLAFDGTNLWAIHGNFGYHGGYGLNKYTPDGTLIFTVSLSWTSPPRRMCLGSDRVYVAMNGVLYMVDYSGVQIGTYIDNPTGFIVQDMLFDGSYLWILDGAGQLGKCDANLNLLSLTSTGLASGWSLIDDGINLWASFEGSSGSLVRFDRSSGAILNTYGGFLYPQFITLSPNGHIVVSGGNGDLTFVNRSDGSVAYNMAMATPHQVIFDGTRMVTPNGPTNTITIMSDPTVVTVADDGNRDVVLKKLKLYKEINDGLDNIHLDNIIEYTFVGTSKDLGVRVIRPLTVVSGGDSIVPWTVLRFTVSGTILTINPTDWELYVGGSDKLMYIGESYKSVLEPSIIYRRDTGDTGLSLIRGKLRITNIFLSVSNSFQCTMHKYGLGIDDMNQTHTAETLNIADYRSFPNFTGNWDYYFSEDMLNASMEFFTDSHLGLTINEVSWEGQFHSVAKNI